MTDRRLPWLLAVPLMAFGSWSAHAVARLLHSGPAHEASGHEALEAHVHSGAAPIGAATVLAPFAAIAVVLLLARLLAAVRAKPLQGAGPTWFLVLPSLAYLLGEVAERLLAGDALAQHAAQEPVLLLTLVLQAAMGAVACLVARRLLVAVDVIRTLIAKAPPAHAAQVDQSVLGPPEVAPVLWTCIVGAAAFEVHPLSPSMSCP